MLCGAQNERNTGKANYTHRPTKTAIAAHRAHARRPRRIGTVTSPRCSRSSRLTFTPTSIVTVRNSSTACSKVAGMGPCFGHSTTKARRCSTPTIRWRQLVRRSRMVRRRMTRFCTGSKLPRRRRHLGAAVASGHTILRAASAPTGVTKEMRATLVEMRAKSALARASSHSAPPPNRKHRALAPSLDPVVRRS